jgi:hypothetical protein
MLETKKDCALQSKFNIKKKKKLGYENFKKYLNAFPSSFGRLKCKYEGKTTKEQGIGNTLPSSQHFRGKRVCWSSEMGLRKMTST